MAGPAAPAVVAMHTTKTALHVCPSEDWRENRQLYEAT
jgi:hypothetical protein